MALDIFFKDILLYKVMFYADWYDYGCFFGQIQA